MQTKKDIKMQKLNRYQIDTLLWNDMEHEQITFEVRASDDKDAWLQGEDYMYTHYNQELYDADTTIQKVGA
jgi:hypothetical protein|tara:strand:+ start:295 stop:507 length:213 start_codon:yes stop_codon:yes gene_type:complete